MRVQHARGWGGFSQQARVTGVSSTRREGPPSVLGSEAAAWVWEAERHACVFLMLSKTWSDTDMRAEWEELHRKPYMR